MSLSETNFVNLPLLTERCVMMKTKHVKIVSFVLDFFFST